MPSAPPRPARDCHLTEAPAIISFRRLDNNPLGDAGVETLAGVLGDCPSLSLLAYACWASVVRTP